MFRIMHVKPTDYEPNASREKLQQLADELNRDAIANGDKDSRWIVVNESVVGDLFAAGVQH